MQEPAEITRVDCHEHLPSLENSPFGECSGELCSVDHLLAETEGKIILKENLDPFFQDKPKILQAIKEFVGALCDVFDQKRQTPLGRYKRLIVHITEKDTIAVERFIKGFEEFFKRHPNYSVNKDAQIIYGEVIYIPIGIFLLSPESEVVTRHLDIIKCLVCGTNNTQYSGDAEDLIIEELLANIQQILSSFQASSVEEALQILIKEGTFSKLINRLKEGVENEEINPAVLMTKMKSFLPKIFAQAMAGGGDMSGLMKMMSGLGL